YLFAPDEPDAVVARLADPATRIVSLTITEGGYDDKDAHGVFALVAHGLQRRRDDASTPFTVMSCDNIEGNGNVARHCTVAAAARLSASLGKWVAEHVAFPSSMVDRITPATTVD